MAEPLHGGRAAVQEQGVLDAGDGRNAAGPAVQETARAYGGNLPLKIFDYLAASRPIVATDIPTHRTVLTEERAVLEARLRAPLRIT